MRLALVAALSTVLSAGAADINPPQLDPIYGEGCWVGFFSEPGFERPMGRLAGALYINSIAGPGLIGTLNEEQFFRQARSVVVGPEARLVAYAEPGFRKEVFSLEPQREVQDLRELGFPGRVASLKILCERG
ncbi:MAG TPA: hypothetical protein VFZ84_04490 [Burkholderiales bacterium]